MPRNNWTLLNGVLRPKLLNIAFASFFKKNLDFLVLHIAHFNNSMVYYYSLLKLLDVCFLLFLTL